MNSEVRLSAWKIAITLTIVIAIIILYTIYFNIDPVILLSIDPRVLLIAILIYTLSWFISGVRLKIIHSSVCRKILSLQDYFYARLLGGLVAYLTPSAIGGEPARAYYLAKKTGDDIASVFAIVVYELFIDIIFINILAIVYSVHYLPLSIPVILVSILVLFSWTMLFIGIVCDNRIINGFFKFMLKFLPKNIRDKYTVFSCSLKAVTKAIARPYRVVAIALTTITMHLLTGAVIYVIALGYGGTSLLGAFQAYLFAIALGALPSPGGAFAVEYGLTITLKPVVVVASRVLMYFYTIIIGLYSLTRISSRH